MYDTETGVLLRLAVQRIFSWLSVKIDTGCTRASRAADETFGGLTLGHPATERVELRAELYDGPIECFRPSDYVANQGLSWRVHQGGTPLVSFSRHQCGEVGDHRTTISWLGRQIGR